MKYFFLGFSIMCVPGALIAQEISPQNAPSRLKEVVVSSSALGSSVDEFSQPASVISEDQLKIRGGNNLGETLSGQPGVAASYFGPGVSRPVIRGMGGDRIRILENGTGTQDVSNTSPDHPITVDPANVKKIELLRGPQALLYGTTAVGGVVNIFDNRIPDELPKGPVTGKVETQGGTVNEERMGAASFDTSVGQFALHADGTKRRTDDIDIPGFARTTRIRNSGQQLEYPESKGKLRYSDSDTENFTVGGSYIFEKGFLGASIGEYNTNYGVPNGEEDISIDAQRQRIDVRGRIDNPVLGIASVDLKVGIVDYEHTEFEGQETGTRFTNRGLDSRLEFKHEKIGNLQGAFGFQFQNGNFAAIGEEAFQPATSTNGEALFLVEEYEFSEKLKLQAGGRVDFQRADVDNYLPAGSEESFGMTKNFTTFSESLGVVYTPSIGESWALSAAHTERAPSGQELFANGPHVATSTFEIGDPDLDTEHSVGVDLTYRKTGERYSFTASTFYNHFFNYIGFIPTGTQNDDLPVFMFSQFKADFIGFESQVKYYFLGDTSEKDRTFSIDFQPDYVWAQDRDSGNPLPRTTPFRIRSGLNYDTPGLFDSRLEVQHVFNQSRVAEFETTTKGYTFLNAFLNKPLQIGKYTCELWLRGTNLLNQKARDNVSFIKDVAPLPGANVQAGIRFKF